MAATVSTSSSTSTSTRSGRRGPAVIGCGLMRTGTYSMLVALERLLGGRCYHMAVVMGSRPGDLRLWSRAAKEGRLSPELAEQLLGDFTACVDFPVCLFYRELAEIYPEAKFLLTVRDPSAWVASLRSTIMQSAGFAAWMSPVGRWAIGTHYMPEARRLLLEGRFGLRFDMTDAELVALYERHNAAVRQAIPPGRLLEFNVADGWQPLCSFLGRQPPAGLEFPRVNDAAAFQRQRARMLVTGRAVDLGLAALVAVAALAGVWLARRRLSS